MIFEGSMLDARAMNDINYLIVFIGLGIILVLTRYYDKYIKKG